LEWVALMGLKQIFADVDSDTFALNLDSVAKAITPRTRAIIPVHLYGQCVDMAPLLELAKTHNLPVVEDNAQAIGGNYSFPDGKTVKTGAMGIYVCTA